MAKRKAISKKVRFEVFKRDSFKCQYCGKSAPEVVLHVDHLKPVSKGGDNEIFNLITSCADCNGGKGATELDDDSAIQKQRQQLEELNERREQLEMMLQWRDGLKSIADAGIEAVETAWREATDDHYYLNDQGVRTAKRHLKKYGVAAVLEAIEIAADKYLVFEEEGPTADSVNVAWNKVGGICQIRSQPNHVQELYYIRGILKNRLHYVNLNEAMRLLEAAYDAGIETDVLKSMATSARNWTIWAADMGAMLEGGN